MQPNHQSRLDTLHRVMIIVPFILFLFQHSLATSSNSHQPHKTAANLNTESSLIDLGSVLGKEWNTVGSHSNKIDVLSIAEGTFVGRDITITSRSLEMSGKESILQNGLETRIVPLSESDRKKSEDLVNDQSVDCSVFSLTNSTLSLKWMDFSLVDNSEDGSQQSHERTPRLAVVSSSMLTISSSRIEVSPWTSAIVISGSPLEESGRESSVVISKSLLWNDVGSMRGVVETSSFSSIGGSVSVSIVGCSFDSSYTNRSSHSIEIKVSEVAHRKMSALIVVCNSLVDDVAIDRIVARVQAKEPL
ncbi:hypothetical protein BLNAU_20720 [Blattamonas nauphoetae]|uniref:Uncharacterized protein n=1 Tax=Blattamonas nauphoetae TaxID=2049346 RepID=A0ABQ9WXY5_9EUKA|nr:hypothetical protein BLNAU_20720 [Blattamonas nauphoetae]